LSVCEGYDGLAEAAFKPIQIQDSIGGVPQPSANFSYLKGPILRTEVAIRQLGYFLSAARLLDLVQGSLHPFIDIEFFEAKFKLLRNEIKSHAEGDPRTRLDPFPWSDMPSGKDQRQHREGAVSPIHLETAALACRAELRLS